MTWITLIGLASIYNYGDGYSGAIRADGQPFTTRQCHIAHRTLPLGTSVKICSTRTRRCTVTVVRDRGPYGQYTGRLDPWGRIVNGRWRNARRVKPPWRFRAIADLTWCIARRIGITGIEPITIEVL